MRKGREVGQGDGEEREGGKEKRIEGGWDILKEGKEGNTERASERDSEREREKLRYKRHKDT